MKNRDIGIEILAGLAEIKKFKQGQTKLKTTELTLNTSRRNPGSKTKRVS